jgi:rRNA-processing protein FCF1
MHDGGTGAFTGGVGGGKMRILIDTNIFIYREDDHILSSNLQTVLRMLNSLKMKIVLHPESIEEIKRDRNEDRKKVMLSKIHTYPLLESPPDPEKDTDFRSVAGYPKKPNEHTDNDLLYSVYKDAVDFLITEDVGIHKKATRLGIKDRVLSLEDALEIFKKDFYDEQVHHPPAVKEEVVYNLNINDPFFDSIKKEYGKEKFETWFKKISREGRKCWVHLRADDAIGALLIYKVKNEAIDSIPSLPTKKRFKIATLKVTHTGYKIGELFIKFAVEYCIKNDLNEIYLTHFTQPDDYLVDLITEYGFVKVATNRRGEDVFIKELLADNRKIELLHPIEISKRFYPCFYDGTEVNKFVVPILPEFHERLFTEYKTRQTRIFEHVGGFIVEGNTIKKAYLCHSRITKVSPGDLLLFYRSRDRSEITSLGVVEKAFRSLQDKDEIMRYVGKRTVYSVDEIEDMARKPTIVILFTWHFHLPNPLKLKELRGIGVLTGAPRSIIQISHEKYLLIKSGGGIDERFTFD